MNRILLYVWSMSCFLGFSSYAHASSNAAIQKKRAKHIRFCLHPKIIKANPLTLSSKLRKALRGMTSRRYINTLSRSIVQLWRMSKGGGKNVSSRSLRREIRKTLKRVKRTPNKAFCFSRPRNIHVYGLMRLQKRSLVRIEKHCIDHDTYRVFPFVPGSFLIPFPKGKSCRGVMYTELRRKVGFSELYSPVLTPFRRVTLQINGQRVDVFVWKTATPGAATRIGEDPEFRFRILMLRKKWKNASALRAKRSVLLAKHKALIDREIAVMKKKMKLIRAVLGGYVLMHPHKGKPAYFGHFQVAYLKGFLQRALNTSIGRWILVSATCANMRHIAR